MYAASAVKVVSNNLRSRTALSAFTEFNFIIFIFYFKIVLPNVVSAAFVERVASKRSTQ